MVDLLRFGGLVSEESLLKCICRVIPGYVVVFENGYVTQLPVYEYHRHEDYDSSDITEITSLHREAVRRRISGYGDFGCFLSGGLDSSLNVAVAAELSPKPVKTFNVAFDADEFDESTFARMVASRYNTEHHELWLDAAVCLDRLPEMVWALQEPIIDH